MDETPIPRPSRRKQAAVRRRTHNVALIFVFAAAVVLLLLLNAVTGDREYSETENRNLAQKPAFSLTALADGSYFSDLTDWYNDQFVGRDRWISLNLREETWMGRKESGGVYLCDDDYLIADPETPDQESLAETLEAVNQFAAEHTDINMQMMLVPGAASILSEYLPANAPVRDQLADIDEVAAQLSEDVELLDVAEALSSHSDEEIYYRTDHHWTSLGAYYAFAWNADALGVTVADYDVYTVTDSFEGTLASKSGSHAVTDSIDIYIAKDTGVSYYVTYPGSLDRICSIYDSSCLEVKDKYTVFFGGNHSLVEINTTANNSRNLLIFKDSYANCFIQFLLPNYENIIMVDPRYYYDSLDSILTSYSITDVLYLYSADTFLTDTSLADVLTAQSATEGLGDTVAEDMDGTEDTAEEEASGAEETAETEADAVSNAESSSETDSEAESAEDSNAGTGDQ